MENCSRNCKNGQKVFIPDYNRSTIENALRRYHAEHTLILSKA